jgi:hypothetical protein
VSTVASGLDAWQWVALALLTLLFVYGEGVRALGRKWVPWMVGRARGLREELLAFRVLAPLYSMSLIGRSVRLVARAWSGVTAVVLAVIIVSHFAEPWRGIVDIAVAAALLWGVLAIAREVLGRGPTRQPPPAPG